jgi:hypothetical protein
MFSKGLVIVGVIAGSAVLATTVIAQRGPSSGPIARYDMRAGTVSGFAAMGTGMGAAMGMMMGGGNSGKFQHELFLRLGSSNGPAPGSPKADHFMPPVAKLGKSVPLTTPVEERGPVEETPWQRDDRKPTGRILIFWGCGEHAPKGQPVIIDLAKIAQGQMPTGLYTSTILRDWGPSKANSKTFGRWPEGDDRKDQRKWLKPESSLIGDHRVAGNYSPEISFKLARDFMAPLAVRTAPQPSGSALLSWNAVPDATGYYATLFGGSMTGNGQMGDMVMWSSSASRQFGGGLADWLTPGQVAGLVKDRTVMTPVTTTCLVPVEVRNAAPQFRMGSLVAFGPQEDFAFPPRPADPKAAWNLQWTARVRHRSMTSWMDMPGMEAAMAQQGQEQPKKDCRPKGGLGGLLGGVLKPGC